jgi:hypothetical protein
LYALVVVNRLKQADAHGFNPVPLYLAIIPTATLIGHVALAFG